MKNDKAILADSAYLSEQNDQMLLDHDLENFVMLGLPKILVKECGFIF